MANKYRFLFLTSICLNLVLVGLGLVWLQRRGGVLYLIDKLSNLRASPRVETQETVSKPRVSYYDIKVDQFAQLPPVTHPIVFLGDSITEQGQWHELLGQPVIKNRGISGDTTSGVLARVESIVALEPQKIFLMVGINDIWHGKKSSTEILSNYRLILSYLHKNSPKTEVYIQSILPVNNSDFFRFKGDNQEIEQINQGLAKMAIEYHYHYINLYPYFLNQQQELDSKYTLDGVHLNGQGYLLWKQKIQDYIVVKTHIPLMKN